MRYRALCSGTPVVAVFWLAACAGETTTEPASTSQPPATGPELAVASDKWILRANMPRNRTSLALATVQNAAGQSIVYAIGGYLPDGRESNNVIAYNLATNTWTFRQPMPWASAESNGAGVINGKIYVTAGWGWDWSRARFVTPFFMYDPAANTWTRKRDLPVAPPPAGSDQERYAAGHGVSGVIDGKLYVVSGCFEDHDREGFEEACNPLFYRYNPATDGWVRLPSPFAETARHPSIGGVIAGRFYVVAGGKFSVYDPATNQWTPRNAPTYRAAAASAVLGGKLYVMGGYRDAWDHWETLDVTVLYNPASDTWARRAPLPSPRDSIAATTVLVDGKERIEVVGGGAPGNNIQYVP